jgi:hypothetical protein
MRIMVCKNEGDINGKENQTNKLYNNADFNVVSFNFNNNFINKV